MYIYSIDSVDIVCLIVILIANIIRYVRLHKMGGMSIMHDIVFRTGFMFILYWFIDLALNLFISSI